MTRQEHREISNGRLAVGFGTLLAVVIAGRLLVVWIASSSGWAPRLVSFAIVGVFVGIPAFYGLRGLVRDDEE